NVVLRGAELAPLIGQDFTLATAAGSVDFHGGRHAHPCAWMDTVLAPGAHKAMRGRGGLRCRPLSSGILQRGPARLISPIPLDPARAHVPSMLRPGRLP
ncbi:molybdenum cofactor biosysynthesis protein, partial [Arthrobacter sp. APC 3897]|nr:molybdenum cofactor biosysynthesis protein [Arthrobacter sp. APC 3897]